MTGVTAPATRLVLLRHAKAEHSAGSDAARPLALAGRRQASAVGAALAEDGLAPDHVLCSSALRTRQTWDLVRTGLGPAGQDCRVEVSDEVYDAGVPDLLRLLRAVPDGAATVLVVGHEPAMSHLAVSLAGPTSSPDVVERVRHGVPTASWSLLEPAVPWAEMATRSARLVALRIPA